MHAKDFESSPAGHLVPITGQEGSSGREYAHYAFVPNPLPADIQLETATHKAVSNAHLAIGRLDFAVRRLPNPGLLVRPALRREAQSTSALEGTYATLEEVLEADYVDESSRRAEVREVLNHVRAAERALDLIQTKPICVTLLMELQDILVAGTRGASWDSGQLRQTVVYIGERSRGIEASRFVPPPPGQVLEEGASDWEKWINAEDDLSLVAKAAIGHYQFETLHPFSDGNGRLGRLVVTLQLIANGALTYPVLNLSPWLDEHRDEYKDHLLSISRTGDFNPWVKFFSEAIVAQADDGLARIEDMLIFRDATASRLRDAKIKGVALDIADSLVGYPVITVNEAAALHNVTYAAANNGIARLTELGIMREVTGKNYGRVFVCDTLMSILVRER